MKVLFQFSQYSIKYSYAMWEELLTLDGKFKFGLIGNDDVGVSYLKNKKKIYKQYLPLELNNFKPSGIIDYKILNEYEKILGNHVIWYSIASDRTLGSTFSSGSKNYNNKYSNNRDVLLEFYGELIKSYESIFDNFKPQFFVPAVAMGDVGLKIFEAICNKKNVKYLSLQSLRVKNYCSYASDIQLNFPHIKSKTIEYLNNKKIKFSKITLELYDNLKKNKSYDYFDTELNKKALRKYKFQSYFVNSIYLLTIILPMQIIYDIIKSALNIFKIKNSFKELLKKIINRYNLTIQAIKLNNPKLYSDFNKNDTYIYFPLMSQPEYGINILGTMWMNQIELIKSISKNIPFEWYIYVKEHPAILNDRIRPRNFHKQISQIPNVKLINIDEDTNKILENSSAVYVISGTSGFEAILNNIPTFETRENIWSVMGLSKISTDFEKFCYTLLDEKKRLEELSKENKENIILTYLQVIVENSFYSTYPEILFYDRVGNEKEYEICGKELANYFYKFINN